MHVPEYRAIGPVPLQGKITPSAQVSKLDGARGLGRFTRKRGRRGKCFAVHRYALNRCPPHFTKSYSYTEGRRARAPHKLLKMELRPHEAKFFLKAVQDGGTHEKVWGPITWKRGENGRSLKQMAVDVPVSKPRQSQGTHLKNSFESFLGRNDRLRYGLFKLWLLREDFNLVAGCDSHILTVACRRPVKSIVRYCKVSALYSWTKSRPTITSCRLAENQNAQLNYKISHSSFRNNIAIYCLLPRSTGVQPFHSQVQKVCYPKPFQEKYISELVRIGNMYNHLRVLARPKRQGAAPCRFFSALSFSESPLVSSGFYQRSFELEGER